VIFLLLRIGFIASAPCRCIAPPCPFPFVELHHQLLLNAGIGQAPAFRFSASDHAT